MLTLYGDDPASRDIKGAKYSAHCSAALGLEKLCDRIRARRSQLTATPDRPIQAGDWVECVDARVSVHLVLGHEYHVAEVTGAGWFVLTGVDCTMYAPFRFKRVDGPHPAKEALCQACEQPAGYCAENCPTRPRDEPACSECKAPAALDPDCGMCGYCKRRAQPVAMWIFPSELAARQRLAAIERKERPRVTATSRMLAAGHPVGWPSNEGEE
jgi:hypothetical protein